MVEDLDEGAAALEFAGEGRAEEGDVALGDLDVTRGELVVFVVGVEGGGGGGAEVEGVLDQGEGVDGVSGDGVRAGDGEGPLCVWLVAVR